MEIDQRRPLRRHLPHIGLRMIKSAVATFLCLVVDLVRHGTPFYSVLAVLQCMQPTRESTFKMAVQRTTGTLVGAAYGLLVLLLNLQLLPGLSQLGWFLLISASVIPVLYTTVLLRKKNAAFFSCVVFMSIVINHVNDANPYLFVLNRVLDTLIGVAIGMAVNAAHLPRRIHRDVLYACALNDVLMGRTGSLSDYSRVELNRLMEQGVPFTIMTMRTPASFLEVARDLRLQLPVILMDGAVLYDVQKNLYLKTFEIPCAEARTLLDFIHAQGAHCFVNIIEENSVFILYETLQNEGERAMYEQLRRSPYRNYSRAPLKEGQGVVYLMAMDRHDRIEALYAAMQQAGLCDAYRVVHYDSDDYPGYAYLKIYHRSATKQNMLHELQTMLGFAQSCTIGSVPGEYDLVVQADDPGDDVVRLLYRQCMPVRLPWHKPARKTAEV